MSTNQKVLHWLRTHRVAVLKGGWSRERPISLKTGAAVEASLRRLGVRVQSIDVKPRIMSDLASRKIDFCFIALHGTFGEDGGLQSFLDFLHIPYTGCGTLASALAMDKNLSKKLFVKARIPTPEWMTLSKGEIRSSPAKSIQRVSKLLRKGPLFIKPTDQGSAIGARRIVSRSHIKPALADCFRVSNSALIERYVEGRELTVGVLDKKALPVVEIIPEHSFYDFYSKYAQGGSRHVAPAPIPPRIRTAAQKMALRAFRALRCSVYGRVDLLMKKNGTLTVLEVNTIPGMTATSLLPDAARAAGIGFDQLVLKIIECSLKERKIL